MMLVDDLALAQSGEVAENLSVAVNPTSPGRIKTVQAKMAEVEASGVLTGFDILA